MWSSIMQLTGKIAKKDNIVKTKAGKSMSFRRKKIAQQTTMSSVPLQEGYNGPK